MHAEPAELKAVSMSARDIIIAAAADPIGQMPVLLKEARSAMSGGDSWATSLVYTVLGLSLENSLCRPENADVVEWLLQHPEALSLAILEKVRRFAEEVGNIELRQRALDAESRLP